MQKRENLKNEIPKTIELLNAMRIYLMRNNHNFHNSLSMAYCNNCNSISAVGGDYTILEGRDCLGDHYETRQAPERCVICNKESNFIKFSLDNFGILKQLTPEILIKGIENGLKEMKFPNLYNENLQKIAREWKRLNKREKIEEINRLYGLQEDLSKAKKKFVREGEKVRKLEEALMVR